MTGEKKNGRRSRKKKRYVRPAVDAVKLRPEEAVLGACKVASGAGPTGICALTCSTAGS